ncbi:MAG: hypothetical protein ABEI58_02315 [Candidatus Nanohaloarchaea archaeon]
MGDEKRFCPNCGSKDVDPVHRELWGFSKNPDVWECNDCGYTGLVPEEGEEVEEVDFDDDGDYPKSTVVKKKYWYQYAYLGVFFFGLGVMLFFIARSLLGLV